MRSITRFALLGFVAVLASFVPAAHAGPLRHGLQVSLTTESFDVSADQATITAFARLTNHGSEPVSFTFPNFYVANQVFNFRLFNSDGEQLWQSELAVVITGGPQSVDLLAHSTWERHVPVPLNVGGQPLAPGVYTVEATVDADLAPSATMTFRVGDGPAAANKKLVYSVESATITVTPIATSNASVSQVVVAAEGHVTTGGWKSPELRPRPIASTTSDGFLEFNFVARPPAPGTVVSELVSPVSASRLVNVPANFQGVRVYSANNSVEAAAP